MRGRFGSPVATPIGLLGLLLCAGAVGCRSTSPGPSSSPGPIPTMRQAPGMTNRGQVLEPPAVQPPAREETVPLSFEPMPVPSPDRAVHVHLDLGRVYETNGQLAAAEAEYRQAIAAREVKVEDSLRSQAHRRLAAVLDRQGKFTESESHHTQAMELTPDDPKVWNNAGYSAYLQGRWAEAITRLRKAATLAPNDPQVLTNLGLALAASDQTGEAMNVLTEAGGPAAAHCNLAYVLAASGDTEAARKHYAAALEINPDLAIARQAVTRLDAPADVLPTGDTPRPEELASRPSLSDPSAQPASYSTPIPPPQRPDRPKTKEQPETSARESQGAPVLPLAPGR